jgi:hypothetical protein
MTPVLDPVWPWSALWEVLQQLSPAIRGMAGLSLVAALLLPLLWLAKVRQPTLWAVLTILACALLFLGRHVAPIVYQGISSPGLTGLFLTVLGLLGLMVLLIGPALFTGFSLGTYLGTPGLSRRGLSLLLLLRLLAFLLVLIAVARPSLAWIEPEKVRSQLFLAIDRSRSMTVQDERGKQSRWQLLLKSLNEAGPALSRLRDDQQTDVRLFSFAEQLEDFDPDAPGEPTGTRTDLGTALRSLFDRRDPLLAQRGLLLLSDGADNGSIPSLIEAPRWRGAGVPIYTFASGNPGTTARQNDVAITAISTSPMPFVPVKGKLTVRLLVDARGYENTRARARLFLESTDEQGNATDREVLARDVLLPLTTGNEVVLTLDAPERPGEVKVKAVIETTEPDDLPLNNIIETFVTVSREGISVLLVDRLRPGEPQAICDALREDTRFRVTPLWALGGRLNEGKPFNIAEQAFDVIVLGDVSADQLRGLDPDALNKIEKLVARGAGLIVLGGYKNLGNGNWQGTPLERMLPVDLSERGQDEAQVRMTPTDDGLRLVPYIFRLDDSADQRAVWEKLQRLDGRTLLRLPPEPRRGLVTVLATAGANPDQPLLIMQQYAGVEAKAEPGGTAGRVLVFGGDTTYRWRRDEQTLALHTRFWKQVMVWLARQEEMEGTVYVKPDVRRLPVRTDLGFQVGLRSKGGGPDIPDGKFSVEVVAPNGTRSPVNLSRSRTETRGTIAGLTQPGIYRIVARGQGKDVSGSEVSGEASARVIVYDEDLELARPAADPEFLRKLASTSGGEAFRIEQLAEFLNRLAEQPLERGTPKMELRPDWRTTARSPFLIFFFVLFTVVVGLEWALRRWWGLV